jgi:hypothetical protein
VELNVLNSILHGELKPWKFDVNNKKRIIEVVRSAKSISPVTNADFLTQLSSLLQEYPLLVAHITAETKKDATALKTLSWKAELPSATTPASQYYLLLINAETLRIYNAFAQRAEQWTEEIDLQYQVGKLLNNIKVLAQQTSTELKERQLNTVPDGTSNIVHFSLYCLKQSLIALYMSIQDAYMPFVSLPTTIEDFFLLDLQEPFDEDLFQQEEQEVGNTGAKKFSFGFKGDKDALKTVLTQLTIKLDLVNEKYSKVDDLLQLLTAKEIVPGAVVIHIGCETVEFQYIAEGLKTVVKKFTPANIGKSKSFKSKNDTVISAQLLYSSNIEAPKRKEEIDNILKYLK